MQLKKSNRANLENRRSIFFQIGLIITLTFIIIAFEWGTSETKLVKLPVIDDPDYESDLVDIPSTHENTKKSEPPIPNIRLNITKDYEGPDTEIDIPDLTADQTTRINIDELWKDNTEKSINEPDIFYTVEEMPRFKNGDYKKFRQYVVSNIKFPSEAAELGLSGILKVQFVVDEKGEIVDAKITRGIDPIIDNIVLDIITNSPKWTPGKQRNKPVKVKFSMNFRFELH